MLEQLQSTNLTTQSEAIREKNAKPEILPVKSAEKHYPIAGNVIPQIDVFDEDGFTFEEHKMMNETKKLCHYQILPLQLLVYECQL